MSRGVVLNHVEALVTESCIDCGVLFAMTKDFRAKRLEKRDTFYCPAGHAQHYTGKTDAEKAEELRRNAERRMEWAEGRAEDLSGLLRHTEARLRGTQGALARERNRRLREREQ